MSEVKGAAWLPETHRENRVRPWSSAVIPSQQEKPKLLRAARRPVFTKAKLCFQTSDAGRRDWRWRHDFKLLWPKCMRLWTECLKNHAVSAYDIILMSITATNTAAKRDSAKWKTLTTWKHLAAHKWIMNAPTVSFWLLRCIPYSS